jgi:two-component system chemotaxis response regulator CheY
MAKVVLVVDDSRTVRQQVSMALQQAGFDTIEASDGQEGLTAIARNRHIAMVVCDVNMPNMNGLEMVTTVKAKAEHKTLPIVMLTTEGQPSLIQRAKEAGAAGWIVKPFNAEHLVAAARKLTA